MHATLLFAPGTDPRSPHLALPSLAAFLRGSGIRTTVRDVDLEAFLWLLEPARLRASVERCREQYDRSSVDDRPRLRALLDESDAIVEQIAPALASLRDVDRFYDPFAHHAARKCIRAALEMTSAATGGLVDYGIEPPRYDVRDVDAMRLADLAAATANRAANLFEDYFESDVLAALDRDAPDFVAVSILNYQQVVPGLTLARRIKERGHYVVIGGTVYTKFVGELLARPEFFRLFCDGVVAYEGESALLELVQQLGGGRDFSRVPNFLYLDTNGRVAFTRYHVEDVDSLPTPDFDGLPLDAYLAPAPVLPILTGKGCYFNRCKFCDIPFINHISKKAYRIRTPERVAADVAALHARYGARHFEITDEALAPKLLLRLADALDDYPGLEPRFVGYARLEPGFTPEVCRRVYDMGMRKLFFGLESGSQATLDHMDKGIRVADAEAVLRNCADAGIAFHVFSIIGFPEETEESARETMDFFVRNANVIDHPRNTFDIHPFSLDLRTDYFERADALGLAVDADDLATRDFPMSAIVRRNARGLDTPALERLLAAFHARLRETYRTYHHYPLFLSPGYEEYAVLYGDHYSQRPFTARVSLPRGDDTPIRLVWSEYAAVRPLDDGTYFVAGPFGSTRVGENALALLARPTAPLRVAELLARAAAPLFGRGRPESETIDELREVIDSLLRSGALQLVTSAAEAIAA